VAIAHRSRVVARRGAAADWETEITVIATRGDLDQSPLLVGKMEKGLFHARLELALLDPASTS
jgi:porphobilinogen deaminase